MTVSDTRQRLVDTALALIWPSSYGAVSVDDICRAAQVRKGSFYHFFASKLDLAVAALEESHQKMKPSYDAIFSADTPPIERLRNWADFLVASQAATATIFGRVCGCACAALGSEMVGQDRGIGDKCADIFDRQAHYYESALRDMASDGVLTAGSTVERLARDVQTYLTGQLVLARVRNDLADFSRDLQPGLMHLIGSKTMPVQGLRLAATR